MVVLRRVVDSKAAGEPVRRRLARKPKWRMRTKPVGSRSIIALGFPSKTSAEIAQPDIVLRVISVCIQKHRGNPHQH
jgi:hypothetical protein